MSMKIQPTSRKIINFKNLISVLGRVEVEGGRERER
jgi:hypothetical protein